MFCCGASCSRHRLGLRRQAKIDACKVPSIWALKHAAEKDLRALALDAKTLRDMCALHTCACATVGNMALGSQAIRRQITSAGGVFVVVSAMTQWPLDKQLQIKGLVALANIVWGNDEAKLQAKDARAIEVCHAALEHFPDDSAIQSWAAVARAEGGVILWPIEAVVLPLSEGRF